ncbi:MAG: CBS domain-containing protein, partial [Myxococcales bacterium]|nr:CBS domain-containing protein [Myxococcales bacterium]
DLTVADVMRHWEQVFSLSDATPVAEAITRVAEHQRSRVPICRGETRQVVGVLFTKDLLAVRWGVRPAPPRLKPLTRAPVFTLARRPAADLLEEFRARRTHLAIVVDEFGQAIGLCTMEDLLEELFGPITDDEAEARAEEAEESAEAARVEEESAAAAEAAAAEEAQPTRSEGEDA